MIGIMLRETVRERERERERSERAREREYIKLVEC